MKKTHIITAIILLTTAIPSIAYRFIFASSLSDRLDLLGYFTIQSNILAVLVVALTMAGLPIGEKIKLAVGAAIGATAIIYQLVLRQTWNPEGLSAIVSNINHGSTTLLYLIWFWTEPVISGFSRKDVMSVIPYPAVYCLFGIFEAYNRERPVRYFFLDIPAQGWGVFALWFLGLTILFISLGFGILMIYNKLSTLVFRYNLDKSAPL